MYAIFDNSLITGNEIIDGQHKELINKINNLVKACEAGSGKLEAIKMLDYLSDYTDFHFSEEEILQKQASYPGLDEHKQKHEEFRTAVKELHTMLIEEEGPSEAFVDAVYQNVINWLYEHIKRYDCSVATYIHMYTHPELL